MQHRFCVELAQQYDIITAVFLDHFCFWLSKNETEDINFRDGTHWIRCSTKYLTKYFPYLTERQIDYQLRKMVENNAYCPEILIQVSAVNAALNSFNKVLLAEHIRSCVAEDIREGKEETIDELVLVLQKLMK